MTIVTERGSRLRPALSRCISVDTDEFADSYWGRQPLLTPGDDPSTFIDLFSADAADELLTVRGLRTPFLRMAKEGSVLPPSRYTASGGFGAEVGDQVSSEKVLAEFAAGATIVLQGLHRTWAPLRAFTRELADELGVPVQVNAYITPASSRGFDPHYDVHDVFVLQIAGEKRWTIHRPVHLDPLADEPWSQYRDEVAAEAAHEPVVDTVLAPGDALYLPRGWLHSAAALGGTTVHLTIGTPAHTRSDLARELIGEALRGDALRGSLPLGIDVSDPAQLADHIRDAADALIAQLRDAADTDAVARIARTMGDKQTAAVRPEPVSPLATVELLADLAPGTRIRLRAGLRVRAEGATLTMRAREVAFPPECADAVAALADGRTLTAGALPGLDEHDSLVVSRRLLREAIAVPVATDPERDDPDHDHEETTR